jgi:fibronectin type 3 domain-containing protein
MRRVIACLLAGVLAGCSTGTEEARFENPIDPSNPGALDPPDAVTVAVGDNQVLLAWIAPEDAERFVVFRREFGVDDKDEHEKIAEAEAPEYRDRSVRNGRVYGYRIASAAAEGAFGERGDEVTAAPALFGIDLANGSPFTRNRNVGAVLTAPSGAVAVQLSEDPEFSGAGYRSFAAALGFELSFGDGPKTVHARFRLSDGSETLPVSDSVTLDTRAVIQSVTFDGAGVRAPGESVRFAVNGGEPEGEASVTVSGLFSSLPLFDDGTHGDPVASDGVYERTAVIPAGSIVDHASVEGRFTDRAGNAAATLAAPRTLSVREPPTPVALLDAIPAEPPDAVSVSLRWTQSTDPDFAAYRLFRSEGGFVDSTDVLAASSTNRSTVELTDGQVAEGATYAYRVYVRSSAGQESGSNQVLVTVPNLRPPEPVNLDPPDGVGTGTLGLSWTASRDRDFAAYRIHRSGEPVVDGGDAPVARIDDRNTTLYFDSGLQENTRYYYRLYTEDSGGLATPGSEIETRTRNLPPPAVSMIAAGDADTSGVTVTWEESIVHDFAAYRLYRDRGSGVGTFSTLVAEVDEIDVTTYRDTGLEQNTTYFYRVFVVDDGITPGPEQTGSPNTVNATTGSP